MSCFHCADPLPYGPGDKVLRGDECPHCSASLRVCKMCTFYDASLYNECKEPVAERVVEKEKPNFCDFFRLGGRGEGRGLEDALKAARALFKD
ncbi:MAG: hypothetical protein OXB88_00495 [Bacteriovoracales bacterium]|nr:hypothetical protein [Bacteriovoracales bacterium]